MSDSDDYQTLVGAHGSDKPTRHCPGIELVVEPHPDYGDDIEAYLDSNATMLPTDFYQVIWRSFRDVSLQTRPKALRTAVLDARTVRSTSGVDYHVRQMLSDYLGKAEKARLAAAYSTAKEQMTTGSLAQVNDAMKDIEGTLDGQPLRLGMDQSARSGWDSNVVPYVSQLPFSVSGQGQQASVKIALAMKRGQEGTNPVRFLMIEEPENHLSHTSLNRLLDRIERLRSDDQQLFVTTHSSFVANRLGLDALVLASAGDLAPVSGVSADTVRYFQRLPGYDTLRMAIADQFVMVEGPSDEILFERFFKDRFGVRPIDRGIDIISMRGLAFARGLELAKLLDKRCAAVRDNDSKSEDDLRAALSELTEDGRRQLFIGAHDGGSTLEPQILNANSDVQVRDLLGVRPSTDLATWAHNNKTEFALRIAVAEGVLTPPQYIQDVLDYFADDH